LSASKSLTDSFGASGLIGLIQWSLVGVGIFVRLLSAFALDNVDPVKRVVAFVALQASGLALLLASSTLGSFAVSVFAVVLIGAACSFGEW
jgi:hypothetical protein